MAVFFCDSSAIVKRYMTETGSVWLDETIDPAKGNRVYIAQITFVEVISAISRREKGKHIPTTDADNARLRFEQDYLNEFRKVEISENLINSAANLAKNTLCAVTMPSNSRRLWKPKRKESLRGYLR